MSIDNQIFEIRYTYLIKIPFLWPPSHRCPFSRKNNLTVGYSVDGICKTINCKLVLLSPLGKQVTLYLNKLEIRIRMLCVNFGLHWVTDYTERLYFLRVYGIYRYDVDRWSEKPSWTFSRFKMKYWNVAHNTRIYYLGSLENAFFSTL